MYDIFVTGIIKSILYEPLSKASDKRSGGRGVLIHARQHKKSSKEQLEKNICNMLKIKFLLNEGLFRILVPYVLTQFKITINKD